MGQMRYEKFVIKGYQLVTPDMPPPRVISKLEQCENVNQCKVMEALFHSLTELFEIHDMEIQITHDAHSFFIINRDEGLVKHGINSPWLCRKKLAEASGKEIAGAVIDLILQRKSWGKEVTYVEVIFND